MQLTNAYIFFSNEAIIYQINKRLSNTTQQIYNFCKCSTYMWIMYEFT